MNRRQLIQGSLAIAASGCTPRRPIEISPLSTMAEMSSLLQAKRTSAVQLVEQHLKRIAELDQSGPAINAIIELNSEARSIAASLDKQPRRSPLHGVPILIKDNIDTADAMQTTAGSLALLDSKPASDADIVQRLRDASVILLGKTNLSEWANIRSPNSTSGWSARGGLTKNPHVLDHNASGSSSGSAAAVAAGFAAAAIGTETNGSIVSPASACGIVGFKPTVGLVSGRGIIPITHWQDTAGPMARTVRDAAMLLDVISGTDHTSSLTTTSLRGKRLGVVRSLAGKHPQVLAIFETALETLRKAGAIIIDPVELPHAQELGRLSTFAMLVELRADLNAYLTSRSGQMKSLADVIAFNKQHSDQEMPHFGQEFFEQAEQFGTPGALKDGADARATARRQAGPEGIDAALQAHQLDALICPTNDPIHKTNLTHGDTNGRGCSTPAAVAGYPHLTVPMGFVGDVPLGLSFFGKAMNDALLLSLGHSFEQAMPAFRAPRFL